MASNEVYQGDGTTILSKPKNQNGHYPNIWSLLKHFLFIVGSVLILLVALRNSITYHLQSIWGASGHFWQNQWERILLLFGGDELTMYVIGSFIVGSSVYWGVGGLYTLMDVTGRPKFLRRYKIQPGMNDPLDKTDLLELIKVVVRNQLISIPVSVVFYYAFKIRGYDTGHQLPTFHWVLFELMIFILTEEIGFYYSHRLFHHRYLYKHFHKLHHTWQAPISLTAIYCHPLEHICSNLFPLFLGPFVMGSHMATNWLWISLAILSTLNAHSGYHLPFFPSPEAHDYHHLKFNQCYGVLGVLDMLHGTDDKFRLTPQFSRHIMMLSLIPPAEAFPDIHAGKEIKPCNKVK